MQVGLGLGELPRFRAAADRISQVPQTFKEGGGLKFRCERGGGSG